MIFDCFTFFNELDILEVRLNELYNVIDRFVLVEATETFQGNPKPLYFLENRDRFKEFADKIIHIVVEFPARDLRGYVSTRPADLNWAREHYQRDQIARGLTDAKPDDLIIVSDVDEIIKAEALTQAVASRSSREVTVFILSSYFGSALNRLGTIDKCSRMITYRKFRSPQKLRQINVCASRSLGTGRLGTIHTRLKNWKRTGINAPIRTIENGGWHFTSFGGWQAYRTKISSFSHAEMIGNDLYEDEEKFSSQLRKSASKDFISELPLFIQMNAERLGVFKV